MDNEWPRLDYKDWFETYKTLHLWTQIVGKVRLSKEPWANHSWFSTLYVSSRGLTTSAISDGQKTFSLEFDFVNQTFLIETSDGGYFDFPLKAEPISQFYDRLMSALHELRIEAIFDPHPNEVEDSLSFADDTRPRIYNPGQAHNFWQVLIRVNNVFKEFRSRFVGKASPVHFFWGSFDLAVSRFSGRRAPIHPGHANHLPDRVNREAYSHEVSGCGFWPGNGAYPHTTFYSYVYPEPVGFSTAEIHSSSAFYHDNMREFLLSYDDVRNSKNPSQTLLTFLQSTYDAASTLALWNKDLLEESPYRSICQLDKMLKDIHE